MLFNYIHIVSISTNSSIFINSRFNAFVYLEIRQIKRPHFAIVSTGQPRNLAAKELRLPYVGGLVLTDS